MAEKSLEDRISELEAKLGPKSLDEHFREQAELVDRRLAESFREQAELVDRRLAEGPEVATGGTTGWSLPLAVLRFRMIQCGHFCWSIYRRSQSSQRTH